MICILIGILNTRVVTNTLKLCTFITKEPKLTDLPPLSQNLRLSTLLCHKHTDKVLSNYREKQAIITKRCNLSSNITKKTHIEIATVKIKV